MILEIIAWAIAGGTGSIALSHWLSGPKASMYDFSVDIACPQLTNQDLPVVAAQELYAKKGKDFCLPADDMFPAFDEHDYLSAPQRVYRHYQEYTSFLYTTINESEKLRSELSRMPDIVDRVVQLYGSNQPKEAFEELSKSGQRWWSPIQGERRRLKFDLSEITLDELKGRDAAFPIQVAKSKEDGEVLSIPYVNLGRKLLAMPFTPTSPEDEVEFSWKVALIFGTLHEAGLKKIFKFLKNHQWVPPAFDKVDALLKRELLEYSRIIFRGAVANTGRSPFSLSGTGRMMIKSRGIEYTDENERPVSLVDDICLECNIVDETEVRGRGAVTVSPGAMVPISIVSRQKINEMAEASHILGLFYRSNVSLEISMPATLKTDVVCKLNFRPR